MSHTNLRTINSTEINNAGPFRVGDDLTSGTAGQVLKSRGRDLSPEWDNDTDTQLNLTAALPVVINNGGGLNREVELQYDANTLGAGGGALEVLKVPNNLTFTGTATGTYNGSSALSINLTDSDTTYQGSSTININTATNPDTINAIKVPNVMTAGTNVSMVNTDDGASATNYDGSQPITISSTDSDTTYQGGTNININTATNPDTINLDTSISGQTGITFLDNGSATNLTGSNYPSKPTTATYLDLSSSTNIFPGSTSLNGFYRDTTTTPNLLYKFLLPNEFMNDNDSSGYSRSVIADTGQNGAMQCYAGTQYYAFFTIPAGYYFSGFRVNLTNSVGTAQGTTPLSNFYVNVYTKTINNSMTTTDPKKGFNTNNLGYTINSGYSASWDINDPITIGAIHCFRNSWNSSYYNRGGWIQFTEI